METLSIIIDLLQKVSVVVGLVIHLIQSASDFLDRHESDNAAKTDQTLDRKTD